MNWYEISVATSEEAVESVVNILNEYGSGGVVIEYAKDFLLERSGKFGEIYALEKNDFPENGAIVKAYFSEELFTSEFYEEIRKRVIKLSQYNIDSKKSGFILTKVNEEDWANSWKKYFHPVKVTSQLVVVPTWTPYEPKTEQEKVILLDPGMAFGTGMHVTTTIALILLEKWISPHVRVIDIGTGSGILAIAAVLLGANNVQAVDIDEVALKVATDNVVLNQVEGSVQVFSNNLLQNIEGKLDIVIANIVADIIIPLVPQASSVLDETGFFIMSGIIKESQLEVEITLFNNDFEIVQVYEENGWVGIVAQKKR